MVVKPETPIDGGIYRCDQNEETKSTMVPEVDGVAGVDQTTIAPPNQALRLGFLCLWTGNSGVGRQGK